MAELEMFEFDPLSSQSAGSYVKSVMQLTLGNVTTEADVHNEPVSNCKLSKGTGHKRPLQVDVWNENFKKLKSDDQNVFHEQLHGGIKNNSELRELKEMVANLTKSMNNMCISLTDRINILESNLSKDLAVLIEKKVKHDIGQAKQEINGKLSTFKRR